MPAEPAIDRSSALQLFESLASGQRLDVFCALVQAGMGGMVAGEVAAAVKLPATNLSFHLRTMLDAGLVTVQQEGRFQRYRANIPQLLRVFAYLMENCACAGKGACSPPAASPRRPRARPR